MVAENVEALPKERKLPLTAEEAERELLWRKLVELEDRLRCIQAGMRVLLSSEPPYTPIGNRHNI